MEDFVKDKHKIKSQSTNSKGVVNYVLENGSWLGDSFNYLPSGIIDKRETGIGATTLEIKSKRHSIIIEPLRITVIEKAINNPNVFAFLVDEKDIYVKLHAYLNDNSIDYKKIMLVVDNLEKLVIQLDKSFKDYFLLFDEIDYMQSNSSYRNLMEYALDIGKAHENFAVVSATLIDFSDPYMMKLPETSFAYEKLVKKPLLLNFYHSSTVSGLIKKRTQLKKLFSYIVQTLNSSDDKILVALNSKSAITDISAQLVDMKLISASDITILVSENPNNTFLIEKYSGKKITDKKLPTKLNFITSAYFNGYDLEDYYRLFIFSTPPYGSSMLSINEIKQIYGRNRYQNGVLECVLITHDISIKDIKNPELMDLKRVDYIDMAKIHVDFANCFDKHSSDKTIHSEKVMEIFKESFRESFENNPLNFSRKKVLINPNDIYSSLFNELDKKHVNDIAYFKIDYLRYILGIQKNTYLVTPLYFDDKEIFSESSVASIIPSLEEIGFKIDNLEEDFEMLALSSDKKTEQEMISYSFDNIKKLIRENKINPHLLSRTEKNILEIITEGQKVFTVKSIYSELARTNSISSLKSLNYFIQVYSEKHQHVIIREIKHHFKIGEFYQSHEIISKVGEIYHAIKKKNPPKAITGAKDNIQLAYTLENKRKRDPETNVMKSMYTIVKGTPYNLVKKKKNSNDSKKM